MATFTLNFSTESGSRITRLRICRLIDDLRAASRSSANAVAVATIEPVAAVVSSESFANRFAALCRFASVIIH